MDIEDLESHAHPARWNPTDCFVRARFKSCKSKDLGVDDSVLLSSDVPEKYRIFVQTWGCTHNTSDSEYMAGVLAKYGFHVTLGGSQKPPIHSPALTSESSQELPCTCSSSSQSCCHNSNKASSRVNPVPSDEEAKNLADLWLLNSCTVKGPAEDHFRNAVSAGLKAGKRLVVAGCVPQGRPSADYLKGVSIIGVQQIDRVVEVVEETLKGNTVRFLDKRVAPSESSDSRPRRLGGAPLDLPKIRRNPLIEILAVSTGCLNACTYCKTKHARGVLASYPIDELLTRAEQAFSDGVKELWLTSEDLGAYGRDLSRSSSKYSCPSVAKRFPDYLTLSDLLSGLVRRIPAGCMLRLGMTNPPYILDQLEVIVDVLNHPRVYAFLHIPVQSGSDGVLDRMKREYTVDEFSHVVTFLRDRVQVADFASVQPTTSSGSLTIATDIICGFPNETEADFEETVKLVEKFRFPVLYINQFFARPGTPAASMTRKATTAEVKRRTRRLHALFRSYTPYTNREGCQVRVLITEVSHDGRFWVGHTKAYEQVLVPMLPELLGRIVLVRIVESNKFCMKSELVDTGPFDSLVPSPVPSSSTNLANLPPLEQQPTPFLSPTTLTNVPEYALKKCDNSRLVIRIGCVMFFFYCILKYCESHGFFT
ncbi:unnamed protein product [Dicrocoelium dendriticum]|nr:unnamed protein product [Dicrocoelium dendriticum]